MAGYKAITMQNSDGAGEVVWPKERTQKDNSNNYYRAILPGEQKDELWRLKVAGGIMESLDPSKVSTDFMLDKIPEGYALMEHTKAQKDGSVRKDTYLFGHPQGKKFRSPAEFIPHAVWLEAQMIDGPIHEKYGLACACGNCTGANKRNGGTPRDKKQLSRKSNKNMDDAALALIDHAREERIQEMQEIQETDTDGEGEREAAGWTFRKGELVWMYLGDSDELENDVNLPMTGGPSWGAGIVINKPMYSQKMLREPDPDDPSWGTQDDDKYTIQLCSGTSESTEVRTSVPQFVLRPWLSRPFETEEPLESEHESVAPAREIARTFTLFERITESSSNKSAVNFAGLFLGAEKIFVGEPVRIVSTTSKPHIEDVLVVGEMVLQSEPSKTIPAGASVTRSKKTQVVMFHGTVYTTDPGTHGAQKCSAQMTAALPHRMRRGDRSGKRIQWYQVREEAQYSMKNVLGRYYEPYPVDVWMANYDSPMGRKEVKSWVTQRSEALGFGKIGDIEILNKADKRRPIPATLVSDTPTDGDEDAMEIDEPASLSFAPINDEKLNLGSASKSRMVLAAAGDKDDIEEFSDGDEESDIPGPSVLAKSPTKRIAVR